MHSETLALTQRGHPFHWLSVEQLLELSFLRFSGDTLAARSFKELASSMTGEAPSMTLDVLAGRLADAMAIPQDERTVRRNEARGFVADAIERAARAGLDALACVAPNFPALLAAIPDPPMVIWTKGDQEVLVHPAIAVVGARDATPAGLTVARALGRQLTEAGLVVVSGLARGVDAAAHCGALDAGGRTVAVLGCGADRVYPHEHRSLAGRIVNAGAIVSEFPPGTPPLPHHFPLRNRIISGLCRAVVVVEASMQSGSLITARAGLEQGRDVLAVPGSVASGKYRGSHSLIKDGARLVETVEDILEEIRWPRHAAPGSSSRKPLPLSNLELAMASGEPYALDDLAERTGRQAPQLLADLATLELNGRITRLPGGRFVRLDESAIGGSDEAEF